MVLSFSPRIFSIISSQIRKFVEEESSSNKRHLESIRMDSIVVAAWEVEPLHWSEENPEESLPKGRLFIKGVISIFVAYRPFSELILNVEISDTKNSLPSPGICVYIPILMASRSVVFP
ncbi:MAG: hypothetical protein ACD_79C00766G0002 [uncultured bacterium]|nr:MAG: hypothetical protein ACD_79C00766G0002 [uncultured bacterium]